ncbi:MAG: hypothetical protein HYU36_11060 [Planctomycetes bacterium]|nr:hypothetical protein [Planctomycetota bacterium]
MSEEKTCPQCARPVPLKDRATCAYCGARLPWAQAEPDNEGKAQPSETEIVRMLAAGQPGRGTPRAATYPAACGACGEKLSEDRPPRCPRCHTPVRDPFTGKLLFVEEEAAGLLANRKTAIVLIVLLSLMLFFATLFGLKKLVDSRRSRSSGGVRPAPTGP